MKQLPLEELVSRLLDDDLSAEEFHTLESILIHSPDARSYYKEQSQIHALTALELMGKTPVSNPTASIIPMDEVVLRQKRKNIKMAAMAAAAVIFITLVSLQLFTLKPAEQSLRFDTAPGSKFTLTHTPEEPTSSEQMLEPGSRINLERGTIELRFSSNVTSIVSAPAELIVQDYDHLQLTQGAAWFHVPENAIGFRVTTNDIDIVDLGTEFGVQSRPNADDKVQVYSGKVRVTSTRNKHETTELTEGMACLIDEDGTLQDALFAPEAFLKILPKFKPHLHWSFDKTGSDWLAPTGDLSTSLTISAREETAQNQSFSQREGIFGSAIQADGIGSILTDWPGISGSAPRSLSYWVKVPHNKSTGQHIIGWGTQGGERDIKTSTRAFYSFLQKNERGIVSSLSIGAHWLTGTTPLNDDQWHHIAHVYSGKSNADGTPDIRCYIDGKLELIELFELPKVARDSEGNILVDTDIKDANARPLYLFGNHWYPNPFDEQSKLSIDELYIFHAPLSEQEIGNLYRYNSPSVR